MHEEFFHQLYIARIALEGIILKPNMIVAGKKSAKQAGVQEVAERTLRVLKRTVPAALPGVVFLSGGQTDENFSFERAAQIIGKERAAEVRDTAIRLYQAAAAYALERGIIIADTKFEFGLDDGDRVVLIDEALTPDSSRFWPLDTWHVGSSPESFDKQYVRNWLDSIGFARKPPAPEMPAEVARRTSEKYQEALRRLMG